MSRFYCEKKKCRKTAWDTPEYLTEEDWAFLKGVVAFLKRGNVWLLFGMLWDRDNAERTEAFFNRVRGWPEGYHYCQGREYWEKTGFPGTMKHELVKMDRALADRESSTGHERNGKQE